MAELWQKSTNFLVTDTPEQAKAARTSGYAPTTALPEAHDVWKYTYSYNGHESTRFELLRLLTTGHTPKRTQARPDREKRRLYAKCSRLRAKEHWLLKALEFGDSPTTFAKLKVVERQLANIVHRLLMLHRRTPR